MINIKQSALTKTEDQGRNASNPSIAKKKNIKVLQWINSDIHDHITGIQTGCAECHRFNNIKYITGVLKL